MIYLIGDSHTNAFVIKNKEMSEYDVLNYKDKFCAIRVEPYTVYNLMTKIPRLENMVNKLNITDTDYLFFSFGEVDIRSHIGVRSETQDDLNKMIDQCIFNYGQVLLYFQKKYKNIGVWSPIASGIHNGLNGNERIPSFKTCVERNMITAIFTQKLKSFCTENNIIFKSIFHKLHTNYITNNEYYSDAIHLGIQSFPLILEEFTDL